MRNEAFWTWFDETARPKLAIRATTFALMFEHLDKLDGPVRIVETGCCRRDPALDESWEWDGCSTVLFAKYVQARGAGSIETVDISPEATDACKKALKEIVFSHPQGFIETGDSVAFLKRRAEVTEGSRIDLLYLDSFDFKIDDPIPSAMHHHAELMAAMPMIRKDTLVVVDDSPAFIDDNQRAEIGGKGFLVARHMLLAGAELHFCSFHSGWTNVGPAKKHADEDLAGLVERARAHVEADRPVQAEQLYRLVLGLTTPPVTNRARIAHGEACYFYATVALSRQKIGTASDWYREAIKSDPHAVDYRLKLGRQCLIPMGAMETALSEAERASRLAPDYPECWHMLGTLHHELGNVSKAIEAFDQQLAIDPNDPASLLDRATISIDTADYETARGLLNRVKGTDREADAWACLGMIHAREHSHEAAIEAYQIALKMKCRDPNVMRWNMSISMHSIGRYKEAWVEHEHRKGTRNNPILWLPMTRFTLPRWEGETPVKEDGSKVKLHVHTEAGSGDNLALLRYLPLLRDQGYDVVFEALPNMVSLVKSSVPGIKVIPRAVDYPGTIGIDLFDYHTPIGSIPAVLGTDIDTVPQNVPYITPDPDLVEHYGRLLRSQYGNRKRIGLCWSSGIRDGVWMKEYGTRKSMHFDALAPLIATGHCFPHPAPKGWKGLPLFISLQVGPERAQNDGEIVVDILPDKPNWEETAALVANLDLVIAVDTAVAHLAGAMNKPLWVMAQRDAASWHFLCWREGASWNERSPWYPTARVFRQHTFDQPHQWNDVIADVAEALKKWSELGHSGSGGGGGIKEKIQYG
jgi:tetratricopeptide (TPR) repeat protein